MVADLEQRVVATHLAGLWREHGVDSWRAVALDSVPVKMHLNLEWHSGKLPSQGTLELDFHTETNVGDTAVLLSPKQASVVLLGFSSPAVSDVWRLSYLRVLVACFFLPVGQAAKVRGTVLPMRITASCCKHACVASNASPAGSHAR